MKRLLVALALLAGLALGAAPAEAAPYGGDPLFPEGLSWAPNENECWAYRCVWDARHQGNGEGQSLILTRHGDGYLLKPISHRRAHWLQARFCERPKVACGYAD